MSPNHRPCWAQEEITGFKRYLCFRQKNDCMLWIMSNRQRQDKTEPSYRLQYWCGASCRHRCHTLFNGLINWLSTFNSFWPKILTLTCIHLMVTKWLTLIYTVHGLQISIKRWLHDDQCSPPNIYYQKSWGGSRCFDNMNKPLKAGWDPSFWAVVFQLFVLHCSSLTAFTSGQISCTNGQWAILTKQSRCETNLGVYSKMNYHSDWD